VQSSENLQSSNKARPVPHSRIVLAWSLRICLVVVILGLFSWGWTVLRDPWKFPVKSVQIVGNFQQIDQTELKQLILPFVGQGFFALPVTTLRHQLLESPWVDEVVVKRIWPATVVIDIVEQVPVAHWGKESLLNAKATLFSPQNAEAVTGLPILDGPRGQQKMVLEAYIKMGQTLAKLNLKIVHLTMTPRHAWQLVLDNNLEIMLSKADALSRLERFVEVYPQLKQAQNKEAAYVDLRYANGISIRWQENNKVK